MLIVFLLCVITTKGNLPEELSFVSRVERSAGMVNMRTEMQYSNNVERNIVMYTTMAVDANHGYRSEMNATHESTGMLLRNVLALQRNDSRAQFTHLFSHERNDAELFTVQHLLAGDLLQRSLEFNAKSPDLVLRKSARASHRGPQYSVTYESQVNERTPKVLELSFDQQLPLAHFVAQYDPENEKVTDSVRL